MSYHLPNVPLELTARRVCNQEDGTPFALPPPYQPSEGIHKRIIGNRALPLLMLTWLDFLQATTLGRVPLTGLSHAASEYRGRVDCPDLILRNRIGLLIS